MIWQSDAWPLKHRLTSQLQRPAEAKSYKINASSKLKARYAGNRCTFGPSLLQFVFDILIVNSSGSIDQLTKVAATLFCFISQAYITVRQTISLNNTSEYSSYQARLVAFPCLPRIRISNIYLQRGIGQSNNSACRSGWSWHHLALSRRYLRPLLLRPNFQILSLYNYVNNQPDRLCSSFFGLREIQFRYRIHPATQLLPTLLFNRIFKDAFLHQPHLPSGNGRHPNSQHCW